MGQMSLWRWFDTLFKLLRQIFGRTYYSGVAAVDDNTKLFSVMARLWGL